MGVLDALRSTRASLAEHEAAKTAEELVRREAERDPAVVEAAQMLGMKESEIVSVDEADEGLVIVTSDGVHLVLVSPDRPDFAGKVGLMFLAKPAADMVTDFPVYARETELVAEEEPAVEQPAASPEPPAPTFEGKPITECTKKELLATIDELRSAGVEIDVPKKPTNAVLIELIEGAS